MGERSEYHRMCNPAVYSNQDTQQLSGQNNQPFYPNAPKGMAAVPPNHQMNFPYPNAPNNHPGVAHQMSYQPHQQNNNLYQFSHPPTSQIFPPQPQAPFQNSHQHVPVQRLPDQSNVPFGNVQLVNVAPQSHFQRQLIEPRTQTPMNFGGQANQSMPMSTHMPQQAYTTGFASGFGPTKAPNSGAFRDQAPSSQHKFDHRTPEPSGRPGSSVSANSKAGGGVVDRPTSSLSGNSPHVPTQQGAVAPVQGNGPNTFSEFVSNPSSIAQANYPKMPAPVANVQKNAHRAPEIVQKNAFHAPAAAPGVSTVPNFPSTPQNGQVASSSSKMAVQSSKPGLQGQPAPPMLVNPLLESMQAAGSSITHPGGTKKATTSEMSTHARQHKVDKYEEDDEDDEEENSEHSETYSSETSSSTSPPPSPEVDRHSKNTPACKPHQGHQKQVHRENASSGQPKNVASHQPPPTHYDGNYQGNYSNAFHNMSLEGRGVCVDLFKEQNLIAELDYDEACPPLSEQLKEYNSPSEILTSTLNVVPDSASLLSKARLPFGLLFHPFKEIQGIPESNHLVRCRGCRTYINPFVTYIDPRRWCCNICHRQNDFPEDFLYDRETKSYTKGRHRPEMSSPCYELLSTPDAGRDKKRIPIYVFLLDVSFNAVETGYLSVVCDMLQDHLDELSRNPKTHVCFVTFDSHLHYYNLDHKLNQPQVYHVVDIEDPSPPCPTGILVNVVQSRDMIRTLLRLLPDMHRDNREIGNCLGIAARTVCSLVANFGGRVTVFQMKIPDVGPGALKAREDPNGRASQDVQHLTPAIDFYKSLAVEASTKQVGFDLFFLNSQYVDMASIIPMAKFTGGCIEYFPNFHSGSNPVELDRFEKTLRRYLTREVAFESVIRVRCSRGMSFQVFHGNAFVRNVNLLSLPVANEDSAYGVQLAITDNIEEKLVFFQVAFLFTNSRGDRKLRVTNLCLRVSNDLSEVVFNANQLAITALVAKMAADRAATSSVADSREALTNVASDMLEAFCKNLNSGTRTRQLACPYLLRALPLLVFALMKSTAFRLGISTKLDDRVYALEQLKFLPWPELVQLVYPHFYSLHLFDDKNPFEIEGKVVYQPAMLPLTAGALDRQGVHLVDSGSHMHLWVSPNVKKHLLSHVFDRTHFGSLQEGLIKLPTLDNPTSEKIRNFIEYLNNLRQAPAPLILIRDDSRDRVLFYERLVEDRTSDSTNMSYVEFLRSLHDKLPSD